jgi:hypothetical protein
MSTQSPEFALLELEEKLLIMVDQAWAAYEEAGAGLPPAALLNTITKAHSVISARLKQKIGGGFDPNNPEKTLIEIEKIKFMVLRQLEQKKRLNFAGTGD